MPIFEYRCRECGATFEVLVSASRSAAPCKNCGSQNVEQLLSVFAVVGASSAAAAEPGPCGACGAPRRGMCGE